MESLGMNLVVALGMAWHPRNDRDRPHGRLRERIRQVFAGQV